METLPQELVIRIFSFCDRASVNNFSRVSKEFLELARDEHLWKGLCCREGYPLRKKCSSWREWYKRMARRIPVKYYFRGFPNGVKEILMERDASIRGFISDVAVKHSIAPHNIEVYFFERTRKLCSTPAFHGQVLTLCHARH